MSNRKRKNMVVSLSSSSSQDEDEDDDDVVVVDDGEEEVDDDNDDDDEEEENEDEEEEEDEDEEEEVDDDDDYDDEEERDMISISSSEDGMELSEEEADMDSIDDDSEAAPATEANCDRVVKLLQGACDMHVLKLEECKAYLRKHDLRITGTKKICIQRIQEHWRIKDGKGEKLYPRSSFTINCTGDVCQGDVVLFTQRVYKKFDVVTRGGSGKPIGKRTIAGRVVKESYGAAKQQHTFTVEILWSKGLKKLPPLFPMLIKGRNLYRLKTFRQKWKDEGKRVKVLAEKHKRGAVARYIRATTKAQSSNKGSKLHKHSRKMETPLKKLRNGGTESSTKAQKQIFSRGGASACGQLRTKETVKTKEQSSLKRKRESCLKRTPVKRQRNKEQQPNNKSSSRDGSPSYVAGRAVHPFSKHEVGCTSTASGLSRNTMAVPPLYNQAFNGNHFFHAGFDQRLSSHLQSQGHISRQLNAAPLAVQRQVNKTSQLPCSMPDCRDMGAKSCVGSFCWKCCKSTGWKCPRHKLP